MKKKILIPLAVAAAISITGCQKSPDSSVVKNKDFDNMIEQAGDKNNGTDNVADLAGEYDTYQTTVKNDSLHVTVNVDAKVDIPKTSRMSVLRVRQKPIDQELLDKVKKELAGDVKLYNGNVLFVQTTPDLGNCIRYSRDRHGYVHVTSAVADDDCNVGSWKITDGFSEENIQIDADKDSITEYTDVSATMTQEQAQKQAGESIQIIINDDGIVGFYYSVPIEVTDTVVDKSSMKSFGMCRKRP